MIGTSAPRIMSMEEYRRDWQPDGWELIIIGPTTTWRQEWGEWEAIRDIVQNALDETERYQFGFDEDGFWISDKGKGVAVADFLLGPPKLKTDYARGKFGEGMKIAALALVRMGYGVHVETIGRELWIIFLEQKTNGHVESLAALWRKDGIKSGTRFHIIGYRGDTYEKNFTINLPKSAILASIPSPLSVPTQRYNQLLNPDYTNGPRIYGRDIYMMNIDSHYSYNLWGFEMAPDRHGPRDENQMWADVGRLWCGVTKIELMREFLKMVISPPQVQTDESYHVDMSKGWMGMDPVSGKYYTDLLIEAGEAWKKAWTLNFGNDACIRTSDRWDNMIRHLGYTSYNVHHGVQHTLMSVIPFDKSIIDDSIESLRETKIITDEDLTESQLNHLELARRIAVRAHGGESVRCVYAAIIPPASERVRTAGLYSTNTQEIYIDLSQLNSAYDTIDTIIHELAHHTSGAEDLTAGHAKHMTRLASYVVDQTYAGMYDDLMEKANW